MNFSTLFLRGEIESFTNSKVEGSSRSSSKSSSTSKSSSLTSEKGSCYKTFGVPLFSKDGSYVGSINYCFGLKLSHPPCSKFEILSGESYGLKVSYMNI